MNSDKNILQLLNQSACLRKSQLLGYLNHSLYPEELRVVELHLSSCVLCSDALEGMQSIQNAEQLIASITLPVLPAVVIPEKQIVQDAPPAIKVAGPLSHPKGRHTKATLPSNDEDDSKIHSKKRTLLVPLGIVALLAIAFAVLWYFELGHRFQDISLTSEQQDNKIADSTKQLTDISKSVADTVNSDTMSSAAYQKIHDSAYLAQRKIERLKAKEDSIKSLAASSSISDSTTSLNETEPTEAKKEKDVRANGEEADKTNAKQVASKKQEEAKKTSSDYDSGWEQYKISNYQDALKYFKTAATDTKNAQYWDAIYYSGMCYKNLGKKAKAIKIFEQTIAAKSPYTKAAQRQLDNLNGVTPKAKKKTVAK